MLQAIPSLALSTPSNTSAGRGCVAGNVPAPNSSSGASHDADIASTFTSSVPLACLRWRKQPSGSAPLASLPAEGMLWGAFAGPCHKPNLGVERDYDLELTASKRSPHPSSSSRLHECGYHIHVG